MFMGVKTLHQLDSKKHHDTSNIVLNSIIVNDTFAHMYEALFISQNRVRNWSGRSTFRPSDAYPIGQTHDG